MAEFIFGKKIDALAAVYYPKTLGIEAEDGAYIRFKMDGELAGSVRVAFSELRGGLGGTLSNLRAGGVSVHARHHDVENHKIDGIIQKPQHFFAVCGLHRLIPLAGEEQPQGLPNFRIVIRIQNLFCFHRTFSVSVLPVLYREYRQRKSGKQKNSDFFISSAGFFSDLRNMLS